MARKKDPEIQENVDRMPENEEGSAGIDSKDNDCDDDRVNSSDTIKNANATGMGAIGRNDQKQAGYTSNHSADAENE